MAMSRRHAAAGIRPCGDLENIGDTKERTADYWCPVSLNLVYATWERPDSVRHFNAGCLTESGL